MQYSLLIFEIVFYRPCNIMDGTYKGVGGVVGVGGGGVGWGGGGGWQAGGRQSLPLEHRQ